MTKFVNVIIALVWLSLLSLGIAWAWHDFDNATVLNNGGYLYDEQGHVIGLWDGWGQADYSTWLFPIWLSVYILTDTPYWWMMMFWPITVLVLLWFLPRRGVQVG